jgi:nicotinate-nucleotide adenylyltransferase
VDVVRLGILGGTFDPIHNGHLKLAQATYAGLGLSRVIFVPAADPPHKQETRITPIEYRLKMVELAIQSCLHFEVSHIDIERPGPHYTVDMIARLREAHHLAAEDCFFIIGSDSLIDLPAWRAPEKLLQLCRLAVIHRPGYRPDLAALEARFPDLSDRIDWVEATANPLSATDLRLRIAKGEDVASLLPRGVWQYIQQQRLYRSES